MSTIPQNNPSVSSKRKNASVKPRTTKKTKQVEQSETEQVKVESVPVVESVTQPVEEVQVDNSIPPLLEEVKTDEVETKGDKVSRKKKNYNNLMTQVEHLTKLVEKYLADHPDSKNDASRLIKHVSNGLKKIRSQVLKFDKTKVANTNSKSRSGFQKPVKISEAVALFTGWDVNEPRARVDVTNYICDYIKQNKLQSPQDGRVILADEKLSGLLNYEAERDGRLTYATIQKLLAKHYSPVSVQLE